jgi:hypothetical protein
MDAVEYDGDTAFTGSLEALRSARDGVLVVVMLLLAPLPPSRMAAMPGADP